MWIICNTSSFVLLAVHRILIILQMNHIFAASSLLRISLLKVQPSHPNKITDHTYVFSSLILVSIPIPRFVNIILIWPEGAFPIAILDLISLSHFPSSHARLITRYLNVISAHLLQSSSLQSHVYFQLLPSLSQT